MLSVGEHLYYFHINKNQNMKLYNWVLFDSRWNSGQHGGVLSGPALQRDHTSV